MAADPVVAKPPGFAQLAKRISAWTTNCLLSLIVLVAGVGFGRQVLKWWAGDAPSPSDTSAATMATGNLGDPAAAHVLQFGNQPWSLRRQVIAGDKSKAAAALRNAARELLATAGPSNVPPTEAGQRFLAFLAQSVPVDQEPGKWRLYESSDVFPMVAGVGQTPEIPAKSPRPEGVNLAERACRVVLWGIAVPMGSEAWTLLTLQPAVPSKEGDSVPFGIPLPPGSSVTLAMRVADGGAMVAWNGLAQPEQWKRFYDEWFARQGWKSATAWQAAGAASYAKYAAPQSDPRGAVDIRFGPNGRGGWSGLLIATPKGP